MKKTATATAPKRTKSKNVRKIGAPPGPRKASEKRAVLIQAARNLFVEKGFEATTMDEIAAAADFAKGTLYHYFSNKADLLKVLREEFERDVMARIARRMANCPEGDWPGRIRAWIDGAVEAYFEMSELHDVVIYGSGMPFRNAMADAEITKSLTALIADGMEAGAWKIADPHWIAVVMFYSFRGGCDEAMMGAQRPEDIPVKLHELFMRILGVDR